MEFQSISLSSESINSWVLFSLDSKKLQEHRLNKTKTVKKRPMVQNIWENYEFLIS